jgi:methionyl-tRNA synthetase
LELVQADVLARYARQRGDRVRSQTGTDDNALKNVKSAEEVGMPTSEYVEQVAEKFLALSEPLELSFDDFIKTSSDPRHAPGVYRLWRACAESGDFYQRTYEGLYCVGCEQFYTAQELSRGRCQEHGTFAEVVREKNWFFKLSRYEKHLEELIRSDALRIEPEHRKNEVLSFIRSGLEDFSISRSLARAHGWGIRVPDDPTQVIYVWWDALANYITALGYGTGSDDYRVWWRDNPERIHVIGKGILRFHAVYWPAMLLSAGEPCPTGIFVHEYLTADGKKISKSIGNAEDPVKIAEAFGHDSLRWWFLRDVARLGDTDFTYDRLVSRANDDLANNIGNLINRTISMISRYRDKRVPQVEDRDELVNRLIDARLAAPQEIENAVRRFDFRAALEVIVRISDEANRYVMTAKPWELARSENDGGQLRPLDRVLGHLFATCWELSDLLSPFLPTAAKRIRDQLGNGSGIVADPVPIFRKLEPEAVAALS